MKTLTLAAVIAAALPAGAAVASEFNSSLEQLAVDTLQSIAAEPAIIDAVKAQNEAHFDVTREQIDAKDQEWRGQVGQASSPMIDALLSNDVSKMLVDVRDGSGGLYTEIFVMDNLGLNVASSDVTSDYWQGDEAKWQETFLKEASSIHISEVELDESTQTYQSQVSLPVNDPENGTPIGAITFGVNVEFLE